MTPSTFSLLNEIWWFIKVAAALFMAGWWVQRQVSRIVNAVTSIKKTTKLHTRQINALAFAGKNVASIAFFPTDPPSRAEHLRAIDEYDKIRRMDPEEDV